MSPPEAMAAARAGGVQIAIDGADLVLEASGPPPDAILELLTRYKLGIVALLQCRDGWPAQIEPVEADAIEERAGLAADRVPACYLDAWARLQCQRALSVAGAALLRTGRDSWSGEDWRAFFDERAGIAEFDGGLPRLEAEARAYACCVTEWLNRNPLRSSPDRCLRCGEAEHAHDSLLPFGTERTDHAWLHSRCWSAWSAARQAEAVAALEAMGIATPAGFPNDFDKKGGA